MSWRAGDNTGPRNNNAKLNWQDAREIREALRAGQTQGSQARKYGVALNTIGKIARGEAWIEKGRVTTPQDVDQAAQDSLTRLLASGVPIIKADPQAERGAGLLDKMLQEAGNDKVAREKPEKELDKLVGK